MPASAAISAWAPADGSTAILMDAPPDREDCRPSSRSPACSPTPAWSPAVLDQDLDQGLLLLTDLGRVGYLEAFQAEPGLADT